METLILTKPSAAYADQIASYLQDFLIAGDSLDGCAAPGSLADTNEWLELVDALTCKETTPNNWVPATQFLYVRKPDDRLVGMIQVRHEFNAFLEAFGGHIGYSIRPSERKKGYAARMLGDCLPYCRRLGFSKVLVTCLKDNEGSRRTILHNGGVYESTVFEPNDRAYPERYRITL